MRLIKRCFYAAVMVFGITTVYGQQAGVTKITLDDMSAFKPQAGNWQIVGDVSMDPEIDVHPTHAPAAVVVPDTEKKKKKTKAEPQPEVAAPKAVTFEPGKGILLNMNSETKHDNLITAFEHGDIELELEVMIPKGSNSGIYLQGRYEVQLLDSWGVRDPKFSDIGGIYRNWENEKGKIYMGKAPISNPAKAAGTWQTLKISFRAPRFDANGNKISNARFVSVELNGVKIHDNVEVPLPTGGPIDSKETASGPLMIQGDHGPVAFRNIQYRLMKEVKVSLSPISYKLYHGTFKTFPEITASKLVSQGTSPDLTVEVTDVDNAYGIIYTGNITVPENASYDFTAGFTGGLRLTVNGTVVLNYPPDEWSIRTSSIQLAAGTYPFEIAVLKYSEWMPARLSLAVKTASSYPQTLSAFNSYPPDEDPTSDVLIHAGSEVRLLRAFLDFKKGKKQRLTHTIGVAEPAGINYVYDLDAGNLAAVWRGDFVDATPMWHDRGDGSFRPLGAVQYLFVSQPLAFLANSSDAFPETGKEGVFRSKGYSIEEGTGRPVFAYSYDGLTVSDKVYPVDDNRSLTHEITLKDRGTKAGLTLKLAEGSSIVKMANGSWSIDKSYYIKVKSNATPVVRDVNGVKELVVPFEGTTLSYTVIW